MTAVRHVQKGRCTITAQTDDQQQVSPALFSHPATEHAHGPAAGEGGRPHYENLFREPGIPVGRDTLD